MGPQETEPFTVSKPHHSPSLLNNNENVQSMEPIMTVDLSSLQDPGSRVPRPEATKLEREDNLPPPIESTHPKATEDVAAGNDIIIAKDNNTTEIFVGEKVPTALDSGSDAQFITEQPPAPSQAAHPTDCIEGNSLEDFLKPAVQVKLEDAGMDEGIGALPPPPPPPTTTTTTANNSLPATAPASELSTGMNRSKRSELSGKGGNSWHNSDRMFWNSTGYTAAAATNNTTINNSPPKEHPAAAATGCDDNNNNNEITTNNYNTANDLVTLASQPRQESQIDMEDDEIAAALYDLAAAPPLPLLHLTTAPTDAPPRNSSDQQNTIWA